MTAGMSAQPDPGAGRQTGAPGSFGALLRRFRGARGMTQQDLAERAGLNTYAISMLERGVRRTPRSTTVEFLAEALKLSSSERTALQAAARVSRAAAAPGPATRALAIPPELQAPSLGLIGRERE